MAQYEEKNQLDYRQGGDTVDDFAQKYSAEMTRVFRFLNDLRSNTTNSTEYTEPVANQLKVEDGKLYIRNATNTEWVLLGSVDTNFGFKPAEATFISTDDLSLEKIATINDLDMTKAVTTDNLPQEKIDTINSVAIDKTVTTENLPQSKIDNINALDFDTIITTDDVAEATGTGVVGKLLKTNEDGLLNADITGNAAKLAGIRVASDIIQDGQVLTYRSATNTWTNENKGVIGSGKALNLYDGDTLLCSYVGDETRDFDLGITANKQYVIDNVDSKASKASPILAWVSGTTYAVGDIVIANGKIYQCKTANSDTTFTYENWTCIVGGFKIGDVKSISYNGDIEDGWLLCNGASVSRTMYPDLFTAIGTTYGSVDDEHFNLPDLTDKFIEGSATAGTEKSAGLPNITGRQQYTTNNGGYLNAFGSGAFYTYTSTSGSIVTSSGSTTVDRIDFDASKSSSIYGNSNTVQPPALTMRYIIKAFDGQTSESALIDVTQYANELATKADRDLSNLTEKGRKAFFPSDTYITLSSSDFPYTAPANGFLQVTVGKASTASSTNIPSASINGQINCFIPYGTPAGGLAMMLIPVSKGKICVLTYSISEFSSARFYYAQGEV